MQNFIQNKPIALTLAGLDPSGGAGLLADIKTFEAFGVYGLGICTANTAQNDREFESFCKVDNAFLLTQLEMLAKRFTPNAIKIGLVADIAQLEFLLNHIKRLFPPAPIIWDPILKASAGFTFHKQIPEEALQQILSMCTLITPNFPELLSLTRETDSFSAGKKLSRYCPVLLKGGHADGPTATDVLFENGKTIEFVSKRIEDKTKHGTGCVLSAAICANLAKRESIADACTLAKQYLNDFIASNDTLLGFHKYSHD